jgi:hypothetical protein
MRAALENDDLAVLAQPSRAGCRAGPSCDATDDDEAFVARVFHLSLTMVRTCFRFYARGTFRTEWLICR